MVLEGASTDQRGDQAALQSKGEVGFYGFVGCVNWQLSSCLKDFRCSEEHRVK